MSKINLQFDDAHAIMAASMGGWLSWLERAVHIREVIGSNPIPPTTPDPRQEFRRGFLRECCLEGTN